MPRPKSKAIPPSHAWYEKSVFGEKLHTELIRRQYSQEGFADAIGYSREMVTKILAGERSPSMECYVKIISVLGFVDSELLGDFLEERKEEPKP